jgi:hypothetical protein
MQLLLNAHIALTIDVFQKVQQRLPTIFSSLLNTENSSDDGLTFSIAAAVAKLVLTARAACSF